MDTNPRFFELWLSLNTTQRRFLIAMTQHTTKREAALALGLQPDTVYRWPPAIDEALALLLADILQAAWSALRAAAIRAAWVKTESLELDDERLRQQAATEILDRLLGRPRPQAHQPRPEDDDEIIVTYVDYQE